jgi:hypothetical protein
VSSDASTLISVFSSIGDVLQSSVLFWMFEFFLAVYSLVLVIDLILVLFLRDIPGDLKKTLYGSVRPIVSQSKVGKRWEEILARLENGNPSQFKVAILEADALADEMLRGIGYEGKNMGERIVLIKDGELLSLEKLRAAHAVRNQVIQNPDFSIGKEETEAILDQYRGLFEELELL